MHAPSGGEHALDTGGRGGCGEVLLGHLSELGEKYSRFFLQSSKTMSVSSSGIAKYSSSSSTSGFALSSVVVHFLRMPPRVTLGSIRVRVS